MAIKKNKPKPKKGERLTGKNEDEEEEYDEFGNPIDGNNRYDRYDRNNLNNRRPNANNSAFGGANQMRQLR
ncbi:MAG: hypothetical protein K2J10_06830 [Muribaculaceae bacterium]|nr:hypothetical protein [Muribaculaceae bacterium]